MENARRTLMTVRARYAAAVGVVIAGCNTVLDIEDAHLACSAPPCLPAGSDTGIASSLPNASIRIDAGTERAPSQPAADGDRPTPLAPLLPLAPSRADAGTNEVAQGASGAPSLASSAGLPNPPLAENGTAQDTAPAPSAPEPVEPAIGPDGLAAPLPNDLAGAPVSGEIVYSAYASWEVDGVFQPTFEIHTPTASYWIVKPLGTMVSMQNGSASGAQWIDFSSGFRPLRGVPDFEVLPMAVMSTVLDTESQTPTHLRLGCSSADGAWQWVWDFYVTHVTFTVNRAPQPFGFGYRGVPGGSLGAEDRLVLSDGTTQGARNSFDGDLPGPQEWAFLTDTALGRSIFFIQHGDDALPEHYQVRDNDSAQWQFGSGQITRTPVRFSLGLLDGTDTAVVAARVAFVTAAIH
jgi:hypothetical protein